MYCRNVQPQHSCSAVEVAEGAWACCCCCCREDQSVYYGAGGRGGGGAVLVRGGALLWTASRDLLGRV